MKRFVDNLKKLQIAFFLISIVISIFFGAGGDGTYVPLVVFFSVFSAPMIFLEIIPEYIKITNGSFYVFFTMIINIVLIILQPFIYYKLINKFYYYRIKEMCIIHFVIALILIVAILPQEVERVKSLYIVYGLIISLFFTLIYWFYAIKLLKNTNQQKKQKISNPSHQS